MKPEMLSNSIQIKSDKECYILVGVRMHLASFAAGIHPSICWQGIPFNHPSLPTKKAFREAGEHCKLRYLCNIVLLSQAILQPFPVQLWRGLGDLGTSCFFHRPVCLYRSTLPCLAWWRMAPMQSSSSSSSS